MFTINIDEVQSKANEFIDIQVATRKAIMEAIDTLRYEDRFLSMGISEGKIYFKYVKAREESCIAEVVKTIFAHRGTDGLREFCSYLRNTVFPLFVMGQVNFLPKYEF